MDENEYCETAWMEIKNSHFNHIHNLTIYLFLCNEIKSN